MKYYKDNTGNVSAYDDEQLAQVARLTELELILPEKEPVYINAKTSLLQSRDTLDELTNQLNNELPDDEREELNQKIEVATNDLNTALSTFNHIEAEYIPLKEEYDAILPIFFDIRKNLNVFKKMTAKEIQIHLNPPISKEQLIADAEIQKQSCADDAEKNITILERKVRLNMATDDDKNNLTAWEIYSVKVSDIDTSTAPDIEWPVKP